MKVCKFGGSSLADATQLNKVIDIVLADPARRIVVVSAPGKRDKGDTKVTDLLIALAKAALAGENVDRQLGAVVERYALIADELKLGEDIIIIGNPGGLSYQNSMTKGIVSAIDREASSKNMVKYIQTDAAINPGNSGGPAVNLYGQVIGIASAKIVDEQYEGMGFCIPSATAKDIIDSLMKNGYIEGRVRIGISGYAVGSEEIQMYNLPRGIVIQEILADGPCDGTDLQPDDVITEADGTAITSFSDIYKVLENHKEGDKIKLKYYRYSTDKEGEVEITLQADK